MARRGTKWAILANPSRLGKKEILFWTPTGTVFGTVRGLDDRPTLGPDLAEAAR